MGRWHGQRWVKSIYHYVGILYIALANITGDTMNITEYAKLSWQEQLFLLNDNDGYQRFAVSLGYPSSQNSANKIKNVTKKEAMTERAKVVFEQRKARFQKHIVDKQRAKKELLSAALEGKIPVTAGMNVVTGEVKDAIVFKPEVIAGIPGETMTVYKGQLTPGVVPVRKKSLSETVDSIVKEVMQKYG